MPAIRVIFILYLTFLPTFYAQDSTTSEHVPEESVARRKWVSEIFMEVQSDFRMHSDVSEQCRKDFQMYETFLRNQTIWAVQMMESSEWPRLGIFSGVTTVVGAWRECLRIRSPSYQGQYCLVDAEYDYSFATADPITPGWDRDPNPNASVWGVIKMYENIITRIPRRNLTWALCIPSSCTAADLQKSVTNAVTPVFRKYDMTISVNVAPKNCRVKESKPFSKGFIFTLSFVLFLGFFVLLVTYYDYKWHLATAMPKKQTNGRNDWNIAKVFYSFSLLECWNCLTKESPSTIYPLYFAKTVSFIFIVIAHNGMLALPFPKIEQEQTEMMYQPWQFAFGFHCVVDIFIAISGFLTFHCGYEATKKGGIFYAIGSIVFRWIRLIPVLGLYILVYVFVASEAGDGPFWNKRMIYDVQCCRSNWWTNMLSIQNLVNRKDICLIHTWYIAVDFQLTVVGTILLLIIAKNFQLGILSMILTFFGGTFAHFYQIYLHNYSGLPVPAIYEIDVMRKWTLFSDVYIQMYTRVGPYMVGFAGACLLRILKDKKYHPSAIVCCTIQLSLTFIGIGSQLYGFLLVMLGRPYDPFENALYAATQRILIALSLISAINLLCLRRWGWASDVIEWKLFLVFGRLAYVVYLSSFGIQYFRFSSRRQLLIGSSELDIAYSVMTDLLCTLIGSVLLFVLAEGPLHNLTVIMQSIIYKRLKTPENKQPVAEYSYDDSKIQKYASNNNKLNTEDFDV